MTLQGFETFDFADSGTSKTVYWAGDTSQPPIVLMHELPGMIPECVDLARRLVSEGFCVFMPLLFGKPNAQSVDMPGYLAQVCIRQEFVLFARRQSSPITNWLRALCREAKNRCNDQGCGVIGMCLTGNFALSLMVDDSVLAPVMSQPSLPIGFTGDHKRDLATTPDVLQKSVRRSVTEGIPLLAMRFTGDRLCPPEKFDELERHFGENLLRVDIDSSRRNPHGNPWWAHSVLTVNFVDQPDHPTRQAYDKMVAFFRRQLLS